MVFLLRMVFLAFSLAWHVSTETISRILVSTAMFTTLKGLYMDYSPSTPFWLYKLFGIFTCFRVTENFSM